MPSCSCCSLVFLLRSFLFHYHSYCLWSKGLCKSKVNSKRCNTRRLWVDTYLGQLLQLADCSACSSRLGVGGCRRRTDGCTRKAGRSTTCWQARKSTSLQPAPARTLSSWSLSGWELHQSCPHSRRSLPRLWRLRWGTTGPFRSVWRPQESHPGRNRALVHWNWKRAHSSRLLVVDYLTSVILIKMNLINYNENIFE